MFLEHAGLGMFDGYSHVPCIFLLTFAPKNLIYGSHCAFSQERRKT